jgi:glucosamine 6-phosphate synthetase-like amidotransferase/phosphosugar isomerase protein
MQLSDTASPRRSAATTLSTACTTSQIHNVLQLDRTLQQLAASTLRNAQSLLIMGRGFQFSTCLEAALKIKELAYIHSEVCNATMHVNTF